MESTMIDTERIIQMFDKFILLFGGIYSKFYIGISDKPERTLYRDHRVVDVIPFEYKATEDPDAARSIKRHFIREGCDGDMSNRDAEEVFVYIYKKGPRTIP